MIDGRNTCSYSSSPGKSLMVKFNPTFSKNPPILYCICLFLARKEFCYLCSCYFMHKVTKRKRVNFSTFKNTSLQKLYKFTTNYIFFKLTNCEMNHTKKLILRVINNIVTNNNFNIISTKILKEIYIPKPSDSNRHVSSTPKSRHQDKKFAVLSLAKKEPEGALALHGIFFKGRF